LTLTVRRPRLQPDDLRIRLVAISLIFSSTMGVPHSIQVPLNISLDQLPFDTIAQVANKNYEQQSIPVNFESTEFWATQKLNNWLSARSENLCHSIWHTSHHMTTLGRVQSMYLVMTVPPEVCTSLASTNLQRLTFKMARTFCLCIHFLSCWNISPTTGICMWLRASSCVYLYSQLIEQVP
jgi:hypothetical protein